MRCGYGGDLSWFLAIWLSTRSNVPELGQQRAALAVWAGAISGMDLCALKSALVMFLVYSCTLILLLVLHL